MKHTLYSNLDDMISPATLSRLANRTFSTTHLVSFHAASPSWSGSRFLAVQTNNGQEPRYVVKRMSREWDWLMHATEDPSGRTAALWQEGLLDRLPKETEHAVVACAVDGPGRAILMRDVTVALLTEDRPLSKEDNTAILEAMAAFHVAFWQDSILSDPALTLCRPANLFTHTSPDMVRRVEPVCPHQIFEIILSGWGFIPDFVEPDVARLLRSLAQDPTPLCEALARFPCTLVHGDWRLPNLGLVRGARPQLILLDLARVTPTAPAVDLAWYVGLNAAQLPISREAAIELYKQQLARRLGNRFDETWWQPQLELSLLAGFVQFACFLAWNAVKAGDESQRIRYQNDLTWWSEQVWTGARWLSPSSRGKGANDGNKGNSPGSQ